MSGAPAAPVLISDGKVRLTLDGAVAVIQFNDAPKRNAMGAELIKGLRQSLDWFYASEDARVAVVTGSDSVFSAGGDISVFTTLNAQTGYEFTRLGYELLRGIERCEKPVLAAVDGYCFAGGLELALACDFIVAGDGAQFGMLEVNLGLIPGWGGTIRLSRAIPVRRARQLLYTAERFPVLDAYRLGLVNEIVSAGGALVRALEIARVIASKPRLAVQVAKMVTTQAADAASYDAALGVERSACATLFGTEDVARLAGAWLRK